ncbi:23773_t:CDS:2, partial [Gigaspora rosea]
SQFWHDWMIKRNDFSDHVEIGINIYKAKCNNETFVLKELKESETIQGTLKIIKILQSIPHPNVVKFHGLINDSFRNIVLVMKFAEGEGLKFLHNNFNIHYDMHTANILVHEGRMMIADFDFSKFSNSEGELYSLLNMIYTHWVSFFGKLQAVVDHLMAKHLWKLWHGVRETASEMLLEYDSLYKSCWDEDPEKWPETNCILETLN